MILQEPELLLKFKIIIIICIGLILTTLISFFAVIGIGKTSEVNSIKTSNLIDVVVEPVYKTQKESKLYNYSGIIVSTTKSGNYTQFQLIDSFSAVTLIQASGTSFQLNTFYDPLNKIQVGKTIRMTVMETTPICSINLIFSNGTKIINDDNFESINDASKYNKTVIGDKRCLANNIMRYGSDWSIN